jgi:tetratricopeptide (TPR) repeat protein
VPGLRVRAVTRQNPAVLYEILPGFGADPDWMGDPDQVALHRARAQVLINRTDWRSRVYVALYERRLEHWTEAQVLIDEALAWAPEDPEMLLLDADNLMRLGQLGAARDAFARAERLAGGDPRIAIGRGWIAALDGDTAGAAQYWQPVAAVPTDARTLLRMREVFGAAHDRPALAVVESRMNELGVRP